MDLLSLRNRIAGWMDVFRLVPTRPFQQERTRETLRTLPREECPPDLTTRLMVMASHERARRAHPQPAWQARLSSFAHDMMRPWALPFVGGLCSAILLFSALVPNFALKLNPAMQDVPTVLFTEASVKNMAPLGFSYGEMIVDLRIDEQGRVVNYAIVNNGTLTHEKTEELRRNLLFTQFTPATAFGTPTAGKVRISFNSSRIEVKG